MERSGGGGRISGTGNRIARGGSRISGISGRISRAGNRISRVSGRISRAGNRISRGGSSRISRGGLDGETRGPDSLAADPKQGPEVLDGPLEFGGSDRFDESFHGDLLLGVGCHWHDVRRDEVPVNQRRNKRNQN